MNIYIFKKKKRDVPLSVRDYYDIIKLYIKLCENVGRKGVVI